MKVYEGYPQPRYQVSVYRTTDPLVLEYANLQNVFCCSFHSQNDYKDGRTFLLNGNFYSCRL